MNKALKHTIIAMATASLGFAAGCSGDESAEEAEASSGDEMVVEEDVVEVDETEASCGGEASCGADEASCGEGSCG